MSFIDVSELADCSFEHEGAVQHSTPRLQHCRPISPPKTLITREMLEDHIAKYSIQTQTLAITSTPKSNNTTQRIYADLRIHRRAAFDAYNYIPLKYTLDIP